MEAQKEALLGRKLISKRVSRPAEPADFKSIAWLVDDALPKGPQTNTVCGHRVFSLVIKKIR